MSDKVGVMIDLETLGLGPRSVVSQVGIIAFALDNPEQTIRSVEQYLTIQPQIALNRTIDFDTVLWWMQQDEKARNRFIDNVGNDMEELLANVRSIARKLSQIIEQAGGHDNVEIWAKGPQFDIVILETLLVDCGVEVPWKYNRIMDLRTLMALAGVATADVDSSGITKHVALEDCRFQVRCYAEAVKQLHSNQ